MAVSPRPILYLNTSHFSSSFSTQLAKSLCSRVMSDSGSKPTQALKMFVRALRCFARALTTGVPVGTSGA